jgi:hypothetical protein
MTLSLASAPALAPVTNGVPQSGPFALGGACAFAVHAPAPHAAFRAVLAREDAAIVREAVPAAQAVRAPCHCAQSVRGPASSVALRHPEAQAGVSSVDPSDEDPLDPLNRHRAALAPPDMVSFAPPVTQAGFGPTTAPRVAPEGAPRTLSSLEHLIPALVRRVAWSGDGRRATARLEIGAGELAGAILLVHADAGHIHVHLDVPPGVDARAWQRRIAGRLAARNIPTDAVEVT